MQRRKFNWKVFIACIIIVYLVAFVGSIFTSQNTNSAWYASIKPSITPPNFIFPIVWNILFFLIGLSLYFAWTAKPKSKKESKAAKRNIAIIFGINFLLNILWSFLFFYLKLPAVALVEIIVLWLSIIAMIAVTWKIRKLSAYLLIPYALWVAFAGILNYLVAFA
jgi:translocator protein